MSCENQALVPTDVCLKWGCNKAKLILSISPLYHWICPICRASYGKDAKKGLKRA